jgi:hypothetical protein
MGVYNFAVIAFEVATGQPAFHPALVPAKLMRVIVSGQKPQMPRSVVAALKDLIASGWAIDPAKRPTVSEACNGLAIANWCVFPGADAKEVADAERELPNDGRTSPMAVALRGGKLESRSARLKGEIAQIRALMPEIDLAPEHARTSARDRA